MDALADFDREAAFLRRFTGDAGGSLAAFARRLAEAMPGRVTLREKRALFSRRAVITGVTVALGEHAYALDLDRGRLQASISLAVRGITLNTRRLEPTEWFERLSAATRSETDEARALALSLDRFMAG